LDDTLVPWDSLSKGKCGDADLWEEWSGLSKDFQEDSLGGAYVKNGQADGVVGSDNDPLHSLKSTMANPGLNLAYQDMLAQFGKPLSRVASSALGRRQQDLFRRLDRDTDGWLTEGQAILGMTHGQEGTLNVILTASRLQAAVGKLMLFGLNQSVHGECIYSCWMRGSKRDAFRALTTKYSGAYFVAIGDGKQEKEAAEALRVPFFHIKDLADLRKTRGRLDLR